MNYALFGLFLYAVTEKPLENVDLKCCYMLKLGVRVSLQVVFPSLGSVSSSKGFSQDLGSNQGFKVPQYSLGFESQIFCRVLLVVFLLFGSQVKKSQSCGVFKAR